MELSTLKLIADVLSNRFPLTPEEEREAANKAREGGRPFPKNGEIWELNRYLLREIVSKRTGTYTNEEFDKGWYDIEILDAHNPDWIKYQVCGTNEVYHLHFSKIFYTGVIKESAL